jgi:hypothetical protein
MLQIRGFGLQILSFLSTQRSDVQALMVEIGIIDICLGYIKCFPDNLVDTEILLTSLDVVS